MIKKQKRTIQIKNSIVFLFAQNETMIFISLIVGVIVFDFLNKIWYIG